MVQTQSEIKQLLQRKIFGHKTVRNYNPYSRAVLSKLSKCHTIGIGVHQYKCNNSSCCHVHHQYHCCGDRHCPNCGGAKRQQWVEDRMSELLPIKYFHVVFTLPAELRSLVMGNRKKMYNLLFEGSQYTLLKLGRDPKWLGATLGVISILHTHGQELSFHPHVHCIVSGGGVDKEGMWKNCNRSKDSFLFPRRVMEKMFKAYFLNKLEDYLADSELNVEDGLALHEAIKLVKYKKWNVYAKAPFAGPAQIIEYLGRYTHKVAITSHRIKHISDTHITFDYKDYADGSKVKQMTLTNEEFLRRFEQHILPKKFVKLRHCGYLCHRGKTERLKLLFEQMKLHPAMPKVSISVALRVLIDTGVDITLCPACKAGKMILIQTLIIHNGQLVDAATLRNRGSPNINITK